MLRDVNLIVPAGYTVAFVGRTGSGKSTVANLIPRLLDAPDNTLFIDGIPIREYPLAQLRASIGYVPQETFLFSDTIAENIAFGVEKAKTAEVEWAAEIAGLSEDIAGFAEGFETLVGERGITLSGGQKQRTAIARAVLREPKILILDDALSSVDTYTEEKILGQLRGVMRDRTSLIISRMSKSGLTAAEYLNAADDVLYGIVSNGNVLRLLRDNASLTRQAYLEFNLQGMFEGGEYADLYERQLL